ncbi:MAG: DUF4430 domain-containing protein [Clostridiales bacterium]|nr:DUF4430 domain-containing protein [Clostridiales bacterium]
MIRMIQKKFAGVLLATILLLTGLTACGGDTTPPKEDTPLPADISVSVKIVGQTAALADGTAELPADDATAEKAIRQVCDAGQVAYTFQNGMFDHFGGEDSTNTDGWLLYINDVLSDVGASQAKVADQDRVEFRYVNYDEAFGG